MSSYFDEASLVMIPSGYKNQKVYSVKPLDGSGDLTFSRASSATRVASNGYIEKVRTNLLTYSNTFSNAAWTKNNVTLTAGQVDPNGGTNGTRAQFSGVSYIFQAPSTAFATASVYVRATSGTANIRIGDSNGNYVVAYALTESWQRITAFGSAMSGISIDSFIGGSWTAQDVIIAFAQFETGDIATAYIATTSAAVSVGPVSGLPRLDYLNSTCPRLLLEPQRSNLALYSEQWDSAYWSKFNDTVSANAGTSPDGYANADKEIPNTSNDIHGLIRNVGSQSAGAYTASVFLKAAGYNFGYLRFTTDTDAKRYVVVINLNTGAVTATNSFGSPVSPSSKVENYGNGWYRLSVTLTHGTGDLSMMAGSSSTAVPTFAASIPSFAGDGTSGVLLYGAMAEAGAYATSYIPTLGTSVTRVAESSSSPSIPSLFGATEGSFFIEMTFDGRNANGAIPLFLRSSVSGSFNQATYLQFGTSDIVLNVYSGGTSQAAISGGSFTNGQTLKVAFAYKANDFVMYVNGVQIGTDTSGAISTSLSFVDLGSYLQLQSTFQYDGKISQAILFPTRLSNSDLAALTA